MGKNLAMKEARKEQGLSQDALATAVGVSRQTINAIEKGDYNPTIRLCISICRVLGLFAGFGFDLIRPEYLSVYAIFGLVVTILTHDAYCIFHDAYLPQGRDTVKEIATYLFFGILWIVAMLMNRWRTGEDMLINGAFALARLSRGVMLLIRVLMVGRWNRFSDKEEDDG